MSPQPLVSVITVCRNTKNTIARALESVRLQDYPQVEHIVIDGDSSDGTQAIISNFERPNLIWISEKDKGISDAFNKGIRMSSGQYHIILNADDYMYSNCISLLAEHLNGGIRAVCASAHLRDERENIVKLFKPEPRKLSWKMSLAHNAILLETSTWEALGGYSLERKIAMDHHLFLRLYKTFGLSSIRTIDAFVSNYSLGGISDLHQVSGFIEVKKNIEEITGSRSRALLAYLILRMKSSIASKFR